MFKFLLGTWWNSIEILAVVLRWTTIVGIAATAFTAAVAYFVNDRIGSLQAKLIDNQGTTIKEQGSRIGAQEGTIGEQARKIESQSASVNDLNQEVSQLRSRASELASKALAAERGVSSTFDYNGAERERSQGRSVVIAGQQTIIFRRMVELNNNKSWKELIEVCDESIRTTPSWLTPYLYAGLALGNLGDPDGARERLTFVVQHAGGDPAYSEAQRLLGILQAAGR